jgi:hypothetical protein
VLDELKCSYWKFLYGVRNRVHTTVFVDVEIKITAYSGTCKVQQHILVNKIHTPAMHSSATKFDKETNKITSTAH